MRRHRTNSAGKGEEGVVVTLVAIFMLFVVGAMAALSIDAVALYTARSEAQLAVDSAALAGARVLANSGATSDLNDPNGPTLLASAQALATTVAIAVGRQNTVGGVKVTAANLNSPAPSFGGTIYNPTITVHLTTNVPTFFARIWGTTNLVVSASATAEAYNPSSPGLIARTPIIPVAPTCVKPWLLPNQDPTTPGSAIFVPGSGSITATALLGASSIGGGVPPLILQPTACPGPSGTCTAPFAPVAWNYFPLSQTNFLAPTTALPSCPAMGAPTPYQASIVGCIQTPMSCNDVGAVIDTLAYPGNRSSDTAEAVNCLTHATNNGDADSLIANTVPPSTPFEFVGGAANPIPGLSGNDLMVSDSLVTVPVFDVNGFTGLFPTVQIVGFVQLFLNPDGNPTPATGVNNAVVNLVGCPIGATGTPVFGNGPSAVPVRLITP